MLMWVFTLPFVLASEMGLFLPVIMFLIAIAFFGLDQVGAELENPYGIDANDYPLLHLGIAFTDDLDEMVRAAQAEIKKRAAPTSAPTNASGAEERRSQPVVLAVEEEEDDDDDDDGPLWSLGGLSARSEKRSSGAARVPATIAEEPNELES
jgi:hypothetical protein